MKLSAVVLLAGAVAAVAQTPGSQTSGSQAPGSQTPSAPRQTEQNPQQHAGLPVVATASCPVELTSATFAPYSMPVRATTDERSAGPAGLDLGFRNRSGKPIASLTLEVQLLVRRSVYDMQAYPLSLTLTAGSGGADRGLDQLSRLALPTGLHPTLIRTVTLTAVTYADGSAWTPAASPDSAQACSLQPNPMQRVMAK